MMISFRHVCIVTTIEKYDVSFILYLLFLRNNKKNTICITTKVLETLSQILFCTLLLFYVLSCSIFVVLICIIILSIQPMVPIYLPEGYEGE